MIDDFHSLESAGYVERSRIWDEGFLQISVSSDVRHCYPDLPRRTSNG